MFYSDTVYQIRTLFFNINNGAYLVERPLRVWKDVGAVRGFAAGSLKNVLAVWLHSTIILTEIMVFRVRLESKTNCIGVLHRLHQGERLGNCNPHLDIYVSLIWPHVCRKGLYTTMQYSFTFCSYNRQLFRCYYHLQ